MFEKFFAALGTKQVEEKEITEVINVYDAVLAHSAWKRRLLEYLEGRSKENLVPEKVGVDYLCVLGKWIHGPGKAEFGNDPTFITLVEEHAKFHVQAAKVIEAQQAGNTQQAMEILGGNFYEQSRKTVNCLTKLNQLFEERHAR